jgi:thiamine-phosphate pyrophosphorylase
MNDENTWFNKIERILKSGIDFIQYRDKLNSTAVKYDVAKKLKKLCDNYKTPLIINNQIDLCLAIDADGVHLGKNDMPIEVARKILGPDKIIGASARTLEDIKKHEKSGIDYFGSGALFETNTKKDAEIISIEKLIELTSNTSLPVFAIGGINENNAVKLKNTGITGICTSSALMNSPNPEKFIEKIKSM